MNAPSLSKYSSVRTTAVGFPARLSNCEHISSLLYSAAADCRLSPQSGVLHVCKDAALIHCVCGECERAFIVIMSLSWQH